jgi:hypothetical protein
MNALLASTLVATAIAGYAPPLDHDVAVVDLTTMSLTELAERLDAPDAQRYFAGRRLKKDHVEAVLQQLIKRGGPKAEMLLTEILRKRFGELEPARRQLQKLEEAGDDDAWRKQYAVVDRLQNNLEPLTALRRIQKKRDPAQIEVVLAVDVNEWPVVFFPTLDLVEAVEIGPSIWLERAEEKLKRQSKDIDNARLQWETTQIHAVRDVAARATKIKAQQIVKARSRSLPILVVSLNSADVGGVPVWMRSSGGDRSGRESRWQCEVRDADGKIVPPREYRWIVGGGIYTESFRQPGEKSSLDLPMASFVELPKPGEYMVTVLYHNTLSIADLEVPEDLDNLIVSKSKPFKMTVLKEEGE